MKQRPLGFRLKDSLKSKEISKRRHWGLFCLVCGKIRCNEFGETQNCRLIARFAGNLIDSFPRRFVFIRRFRTRKRYFDLQTIEGAAKSNATRHSRGMAMKAVSAGGDNGSPGTAGSSRCPGPRRRQDSGRRRQPQRRGVRRDPGEPKSDEARSTRLTLVGEGDVASFAAIRTVVETVDAEPDVTLALADGEYFSQSQYSSLLLHCEQTTC